jgi:Cyclic-phosphate processing Receiver domain
MKVWLDDRRTPPDEDWLWVETSAEAIALLRDNEVEELSLDHDLAIFDADGREETGYDVLLWIEEQVNLHRYHPPRLNVHSANPPARKRMEEAIQAIERRAT